MSSPAPSAPTPAILVGAGGYGEQYARQLLAKEEQGSARLVAVVDPTGAQRRDGHPLAGRDDLPGFGDLAAALAAAGPAAVVIASPIAFHVEHLSAAVAAGAPVLVEKPLCAGAQDIAACRALAAQARAPIHVGYQLSYTASMRVLKRRFGAGEFGAAQGLQAHVSWPRDHAYYARNAWAGRLHDERGRAVLDSPANNACAHFLFTMLWLLGEREASAAPATIERVQLARAYPIASFDTVLLHARCAGVPLHFAATHADPELSQPLLDYRFERARVHMHFSQPLIIDHADGRREELEAPANDHTSKLDHLLDANLPVCAEVEAGLCHAELIAALHEHPIHDLAPARIRREDERISVDGLGEALRTALAEDTVLNAEWFE